MITDVVAAQACFIGVFSATDVADNTGVGGGGGGRLILSRFSKSLGSRL